MEKEIKAESGKKCTLKFENYWLAKGNSVVLPTRRDITNENEQRRIKIFRKGRTFLVSFGIKFLKYKYIIPVLIFLRYIMMYEAPRSFSRNNQFVIKTKYTEKNRCLSLTIVIYIYIRSPTGYT